MNRIVGLMMLGFILAALSMIIGLVKQVGAQTPNGQIPDRHYMIQVQLQDGVAECVVLDNPKFPQRVAMSCVRAK